MSERTPSRSAKTAVELKPSTRPTPNITTAPPRAAAPPAAEPPKPLLPAGPGVHEFRAMLSTLLEKMALVCDFCAKDIPPRQTYWHCTSCHVTHEFERQGGCDICAQCYLADTHKQRAELATRELLDRRGSLTFGPSPSPDSSPTGMGQGRPQSAPQSHGGADDAHAMTNGAAMRPRMKSREHPGPSLRSAVVAHGVAAAQQGGGGEGATRPTSSSAARAASPFAAYLGGSAGAYARSPTQPVYRTPPGASSADGSRLGQYQQLVQQQVQQQVQGQQHVEQLAEQLVQQHVEQLVEQLLSEANSLLLARQL